MIDKILLLITISTLVVIMQCFGHSKLDLNKKKVRLCGDQLDDLLKITCMYRFNKRGSEDKEIASNELNGPESNIASFFSFVTKKNEINIIPQKFRRGESSNRFITKENALEIIPPKFRRGDNIVDECCLKSCRMEELQMYCYE